jgi:hypothetical protein
VRETSKETPLEQQKKSSGSAKSKHWANEQRIKLLNVACHTPRIEELTIQRKNKETFQIKPTIHIVLSQPYGTFKTTLYSILSGSYGYKEHPFVYVSKVTAAGIQGSIDQKSREVVCPLPYEAKHGTLFIDEFNPKPEEARDVTNAFLEFLEYETVNKRIGYKVKKDTVDEARQFSVQGGFLKYWGLRENVIIATMRNIRKSHETFYRAFLSRCVPIVVQWKIKDMKAIDDDPSKLFKRICFDVKPKRFVPFEDYKQIRDFVDKYEGYLKVGDYFRTVNDCVRAFAVIGRHDFDLYEYICLCRIYSALRY